MTKQLSRTILLLALCAQPLSALADSDDAARGAYLARIMDCAGCHMPRGPDGAPMAERGLSGGTVGFEIPGLGIFWPPNLTQAASGLGGWSDAQIAEAIRGGVTPDGRVLAPAMPWMSYAELSDADTTALVAFLRSLPPVDAPRLASVTDAGAAQAPFYRVTLPGQ